MTRQEAIAYGKRVIDLGLNDETQAFCELAIKALEHPEQNVIAIVPCGDTISRQAVLADDCGNITYCDTKRFKVESQESEDAE